MRVLECILCIQSYWRCKMPRNSNWK